MKREIKQETRKEEKTGEVLIICGFGTADREEMERTFGRLLEKARRKAPDQTVLLALTSRKVISSLYEKYGIRIRDVKTALEEAVQGGAVKIRILPVLVAGGSEYDKLKDLSQTFRDRGIETELGSPLLAGSGACRLAEVFIKEAEARNIPEDEAILYIGHGSHDKGQQAQAVYRNLQEILRRKGNRNIFTGDLLTGPEPRGWRRFSRGKMKPGISLKMRPSCTSATDPMTRGRMRRQLTGTFRKYSAGWETGIYSRETS